MLQRANYVSTILGQLRQVPSAAKAHERHLDGVLGPGTVQELNNARDDRSQFLRVDERRSDMEIGNDCNSKWPPAPAREC